MIAIITTDPTPTAPSATKIANLIAQMISFGMTKAQKRNSPKRQRVR